MTGESARQNGPVPHPGPIRCLILDDSSFDRRLIRAAARCASVDFAVSEVAEFRGAHERILAERPDICLVDLHLPDGDGLDLVRQLTKDPATATIPVLALSAAEAPPLAEAAMRAGARGLLAKRRLTGETLEAAVRAALAAPQPVPGLPEGAEPVSGVDAEVPELVRLGRLKAAVLQLLAQSWKLIDAGEGADDEARGRLSQFTRQTIAEIDDLTIDAALGTGEAAPETFPLVDVLREAVSGLAETLRARGARVDAGALPRVTGVRAQFRMLFEQFLLHGLRFARLGLGPVVEFGGGQARDGSWTLWYRDSGINLATRLQSDRRVFESPDAADGGGVPAGFGLSVCQRLAERNGGTLAIFGEEDGGCRVVMRFGRAKPAPRKEAEAPA